MLFKESFQILPADREETGSKPTLEERQQSRNVYMRQLSTGFTVIFSVVTARRHLICFSSKKRVIHFHCKKLYGLGTCLPDVMKKNPSLSLNSDCILCSHLSQLQQHDSEATNWFPQTTCSQLWCLITQYTQTSRHTNISCQLFQEPFCSCEAASNCAGGRHGPLLPEEFVPCSAGGQWHYTITKALQLRYGAANLVP